MRRTGRTTRMLQEAVAAAREGKYVLVASGNFLHATRLVNQLFDLLEGDKSWRYIRSSLKFYIGDGSISFQTVGPSSYDEYAYHKFDWVKMRFLGTHPDCLTLVDHFAIESNFASVLEMLHRYDANEVA